MSLLHRKPIRRRTVHRQAARSAAQTIPCLELAEYDSICAIIPAAESRKSAPFARPTGHLKPLRMNPAPNNIHRTSHIGH
jgi:hypothetical protein